MRAEPRAELAGDCKDWAGKVFICVEIVAPEPGEVDLRMILRSVQNKDVNSQDGKNICHIQFKQEIY